MIKEELIYWLFVPRNDPREKEVREALDNAGINYVLVNTDDYALMSGSPYPECYNGIESILFFAYKEEVKQKMQEGRLKLREEELEALGLIGNLSCWTKK